MSKLTNADIIRMAKTTSDQVLITIINEAIAAEATRFDLDPTDRFILTANGVTPAVIAAMAAAPARLSPRVEVGIDAVDDLIRTTALAFGVNVWSAEKGRLSLSTSAFRAMSPTEQDQFIHTARRYVLPNDGPPPGFVKTIKTESINDGLPTGIALIDNDDRKLTSISRIEPTASEIAASKELEAAIRAQRERAETIDRLERAAELRRNEAADRLERARIDAENARLDAENRLRDQRNKELADSQLLFVKGAEFRPTEQNDSWVRFGWKVAVKNSADYAQEFDLIVQFLDRDGFVLDTAREWRQTIRAFGEQTLTGDALVRMPGATRVAQVKAIIKRRK